MTKRTNPMRTSLRRLAAVTGVAFVAVAAGACAGVGANPSAELTTMSPAWTNWFKLDWTQEAEPSGSRRVTGYIENGYGELAIEVQLLTQALDKSGGVLGQRLTWAGHVGGLSRKYFEVRNLPAADDYRVTVWAFSFHQSPSWQ